MEGGRGGAAERVIACVCVCVCLSVCVSVVVYMHTVCRHIYIYNYIPRQTGGV